MRNYKKFILLGSIFCLALFLFTPKIASAFGLSDIWGGYKNILSTIWSPILGGALKIALKLAEWILRLALWMTDRLAAGDPFGISYTTPGPAKPDNFIIEVGWTLMRDLVNMCFILGLVYIGLATALDFGNKFATSKTFRNLLLIALLINFTPAICGVVVDIGNVVYRFFLQSLDFNVFRTVFQKMQGELSRHWTDVLLEGSLFMQSLFMIVFGWAAALLLIFTVAYFYYRGFRIWISVIISPIYFFLFIFDKTRPQFKKWWDHFIKLAITTPVCLAFFIYLAQFSLSRLNEVFSLQQQNQTSLPAQTNVAYNNTTPESDFIDITASLIANESNTPTPETSNLLAAAGDPVAEEESGMADFFTNIIPFMLPLFFLGFGLKISLGKQMMQAASMIVSTAVGIATGGAGFAAKAGGAAMAVGKKAMSAAGNAAVKAGLGGERLSPGQPGYSRFKAAAFQNPLTRRITNKAIATASERANDGVDKQVNALSGKTTATKKMAVENALFGRGSWEKQIGAISAATKDGDINELTSSLSSQTKKDIIRKTFKYDPSQMDKIKHIDPEAVAQVANEMRLNDSQRKRAGIYMSAQEKQMYSGHSYKDEQGNTKQLDALATKIMAQAKPAEMQAFTSDTMKKAISGDIANKFWNGGQVGKAAELFGSQFLQIFRNGIKDQDWYEKNNQLMGGFLQSTAGQALGFNAPAPAPLNIKIEQGPSPAQPKPEPQVIMPENVINIKDAKPKTYKKAA